MFSWEADCCMWTTVCLKSQQTDDWSSYARFYHACVDYTFGSNKLDNGFTRKVQSFITSWFVPLFSYEKNKKSGCIEHKTLIEFK